MATKKKTSGKKTPAKKKTSGMWAKNKADYASKQAKKTQWAKKASGFEKKKMKGYDGKTRTYLVKTDSLGRMRIVDNGQPAPRGYTNASKGYYGLKKNLRARGSDKQKAFAAAHRAEILGAHPEGLDEGAIDRMGQRGQVNAEKGILYANFRTDPKIRKMMNEVEAFFDGNYGHAGKGKKMSKNILSFGQDGREA